MNKTALFCNSQRTRQFSKATARCLLLLTAVLTWLHPNDSVAEPTAASVKDNPAEHLVTTAKALKQAHPALFGTAEGILVTLVVPDGQAATAGLVPGDVLIGYGATPIDSVQQLTEQIAIAADDSRITLIYLRGEQRQQAAINGGAIGVGLQDLAETPFTRMIALLQQGQQALAAANYSEAVSLFGNGLTLAETQQHQQAQALCHESLGYAFTELDDLQQALLHHRQALAIDRAADDRQREAADPGNIGSVLAMQNRATDSLESYQQALLIHRRTGDPSRAWRSARRGKGPVQPGQGRG